MTEEEAGAKRIRIFIADDHLLFTEGLVAMLAPSFDIVGKAGSGRDVLPKVIETRPDILLLDFNLPQLNGLEVAKLIRSSMPELKVVILTMYNEKRFIDLFQKAGIKAYLLKTSGKEEVERVIRLVHAGEEYFNIDQGRRAGALHSEDFFLKTFSLTQRELEIIGMIKEGLGNKEIADKLCLSPYTVDTHRKNIHVKLGVTKVSDLIRFAIEHHL